MTVVDLHPEDLLEKDAQGSLEAGERTRLEAHLAHCSACRMERQLRLDFAAELEAEIPLDRIVGLGVESIPVVPQGRESMMVLRARRPRRHRVVWLLAAAALLVGGVAAAAMGMSETRWSSLRGVLATPASGVAPAAPVPAKGHGSAVAVADVPEPAPVAAAAEPVTETLNVPAVAPRPAPRAAVVATPAPVVGPSELFDAATEARRRGDYGHVLDLDGQLETRYPTSREAQVSRAIVGRLLLDRGDPAGALARFDSYLAAGAGELGEEAMVGRATALDRLGRTDEATRGWAAMVAAFPGSPYAARARARLETANGR